MYNVILYNIGNHTFKSFCSCAKQDKAIDIVTIFSSVRSTLLKTKNYDCQFENIFDIDKEYAPYLEILNKESSCKADNTRWKESKVFLMFRDALKYIAIFPYVTDTSHELARIFYLFDEIDRNTIDYSHRELNDHHTKYYNKETDKYTMNKDMSEEDLMLSIDRNYLIIISEEEERLLWNVALRVLIEDRCNIAKERDRKRKEFYTLFGVKEITLKNKDYRIVASESPLIL